jgi:hypothetical protein
MSRFFTATFVLSTLLAASAAAQDNTPNLAGVAPTEPGKPAVARGGQYMGFAEKFNRYYTDPAWKPSKTVYVSPNGNGDGATRDTPMSAPSAVAAARPGTQIHFIRGNYQACFKFSKETSGSYDNPVVLYAERNQDKSIGVSINCCNSGQQACFNFEAADHVALDGFELIGGRYGVRAVGEGYPASQHSRGIAVLNSKGHDQDKDPFLSAQADWAVWEGNVGYGAKAGDGHGIYLSNGSDWNIVRFNETFGNVSSDLQINADPESTCKEVGIPFTDPRCDAYAGTGEGGQGASDYFLVDSNYFHHSTGNGPGPNFTSVRRSVIRNNVFGFYNTRHGVSFWQETDNPKLGSSDNKIVHNLFVTTARHGVKFELHSTRNEFANNVIVGVRVNGGTVTANPQALLMEVDGTVDANVYRENLYVSGKMEGRTPNAQETAQADFSSDWFRNFPTVMNHDPNDFTPAAGAPFRGMGTLSQFAPSDRNGTVRSGKVDLGPIAAALEVATTISLGPNADLGGRRLLPDDSPWHRDISKDPVDPNSSRILARIGMDAPLRNDFGTEWEGAPMGMPYVVVSKDQRKVPVTFTYADESDPGPYPIPPDAPIEGGPKGTGDRHIIVLDRDTGTLWELSNAIPNGAGWKADSGAIWDLKKNQVRPARWTSADAAGLPVLPGLVRYDEVVGKKMLEHAVRFTLAKTRRAYVPPASHWASSLYDDDLPPMGMRVRLKADYDLSGFSSEARVILQALKKYGMILADNGSNNHITGAPDPRWNMDALRQLTRVKTKDLEVVEMKDIVVDRRR